MICYIQSSQSISVLIRNVSSVDVSKSGEVRVLG